MNRSRLALSLLIAGTATVSSADAANAPAWPGHNGNNEHTGFVDLTVSGRATESWARFEHAAPVIAAVAGDGIVFSTPSTYFQTASLVANDLATGTELWRQSFDNYFSVNAPAVDLAKHRVYVETIDGSQTARLRAYDVVTGQFQWLAPLSAQWEHYLSPVIIGDRILAQAGTYGGLYSVNASTASVDWMSFQQQYDQWAPTTWSDPTSVVGYTNQLVVVDLATGVNRFTLGDPQYVWNGYTVGQAPIVLGDHAFVTNGGKVVPHDLTQRTLLPKFGNAAVGQISTDGKDLFFIDAGALTVRDPVGAFRWSAEVQNDTLRAPAIVFRNAVVVSGNNATYLIDRQTHAVVQTLRGAGKILYADDTLVIGTGAGEIIAYTLPGITFADGFE